MPTSCFGSSVHPTHFPITVFFHQLRAQLPSMKHVGNAIKKLRYEKNWSQQGLANSVPGLSQPVLSKIENGTRTLKQNSKLAIRIAEVLDVSVEDLFNPELKKQINDEVVTRQEVLHLQEEMKKLTLKSEYLTQIIVDLTQKSQQLLLLLSGESQKSPLFN